MYWFFSSSKGRSNDIRVFGYVTLLRNYLISVSVLRRQITQLARRNNKHSKCFNGINLE